MFPHLDSKSLLERGARRYISVSAMKVVYIGMAIKLTVFLSINSNKNADNNGIISANHQEKNNWQPKFHTQPLPIKSENEIKLYKDLKYLPLSHLLKEILKDVFQKERK